MQQLVSPCFACCELEFRLSSGRTQLNSVCMPDVPLNHLGWASTLFFAADDFLKSRARDGAVSLFFVGR
jgi:hypothetical protein